MTAHSDSYEGRRLEATPYPGTEEGVARITSDRAEDNFSGPHFDGDTRTTYAWPALEMNRGGIQFTYEEDEVMEANPNDPRYGTPDDPRYAVREDITTGGTGYLTPIVSNPAPREQTYLDDNRLIVAAAWMEAAIAHLDHEQLRALRDDYPTVVRAWYRLQDALGGR